jgi:hypothetical protein
MTNQRIPALMDEYPLLVYPSLAVAMGVNKAIVFQQLHFLLCNQKTAKNEYVFIDGRWWVYNTYSEWQEGYFCWLTTITLKRIFIELRKDNLIITRQSVKNKSDRRKWYTIDYERWNHYRANLHLLDTPMDQNDTMVDGIILIPSNVSKSSDGYSETKTETTTETPINTSGAGAPVTKPSKPREPDLIFDAVARGHGMNPDEINGKGGRIAMIANWLKGTYSGKGMRDVGLINHPASVQHIEQFFSDWPKDSTPPLDFVKFVENWRKWATKKSGTNKPAFKSLIKHD